MADLNIELDELAALSDSLTDLHAELDGAEKFSETVAGYAGDDQLAQVIRDFASGWNKRRGFLLEDLEQLAAAAEAIRDTFVELDREIAAGLYSNASMSTGYSGAGAGGGGGGGR